jgi:hypothetical protein
MVCVGSTEHLCAFGELVLRISAPWLAATSTPRVSELPETVVGCFLDQQFAARERDGACS